MKEFLMLLDSRYSGVYRLDDNIDLEDIESGVKSAELAFMLIDGSSLHSKEEFLEEAAEALNFPDYFGHNWDAFEDCLADLTAVEPTNEDAEPTSGFVIIYDHPDVLREHAPAEFQTALDIFHSSVDYWRGQDKPLLVFLRGDQPIAGVEELT